MGDLYKVEFELDEKRHAELLCEAERLGLTASEIARRAVAAWLVEMLDDSPCKHEETATL